jgi:hypothetical protein
MLKMIRRKFSEGKDLPLSLGGYAEMCLPIQSLGDMTKLCSRYNSITVDHSSDVYDTLIISFNKNS